MHGSKPIKRGGASLHLSKPYFMGIVGGIFTVFCLGLLPLSYIIEISAVLLALIPAIYVGFALMDGRRSVIRLEVTHLACFFALSLLGLWYSEYMLVVGYIVHGLWDLAHHSKGITTEHPRGYVPFCVVYDWIVAAGLLLYFVTA
jgi:hypothetical protein